MFLCVMLLASSVLSTACIFIAAGKYAVGLVVERGDHVSGCFRIGTRDYACCDGHVVVDLVIIRKYALFAILLG